MDASLLISPLIVAAQFLVSMSMYSWRQARRDRFWARAAACAAIFLCAVIFTTWIGSTGVPVLMDEWALPSQILAFSLLAIGWIAIICLCYDIRPIYATFIVIAGYSTQNLADGVAVLGEFLCGEVILDVLCGWLPGLGNELAQNIVDGAFAVAATCIVFPICYRTFARKLDERWLGKPQDAKILLMFALVLMVEICLDLTIKSLFEDGVTFMQHLLLALAKPMLSLFILFTEFEIMRSSRTEAEREALAQLARDRSHQYETQRANMEAINIKVHDIRHQINDLSESGRGANERELQALMDEVAIYDTNVETGNEALDTVLSEKALICGRDHIALTCLADGAALGFLTPAETYSLFGNALDNAIDAVRKVEDPTKRSISLVVTERVGMVTVHVENYFEGELTFKDGLPQTTSDDTFNHGFGMRSMRHVAEEHGGALTAKAKDGVFYLNVAIPLPADKEE